jgi:hypothetical protein
VNANQHQGNEFFQLVYEQRLFKNAVYKCSIQIYLELLCVTHSLFPLSVIDCEEKAQLPFLTTEFSALRMSGSCYAMSGSHS